LEAAVGFTAVGPELELVPIIHRGSALPARYERAFSKMYDDQDHVDVRIFQGEEPEPDENVHIGTISLNLEKGGGAANKIVVGFNLTLDGVLRVTAKQPSSGRIEEIKIDNALSAMSALEKQEAHSRLISMFEQSPEFSNATWEALSNGSDDEIRLDKQHTGSGEPHRQLIEDVKSKFPKAIALLEQAGKMSDKIQGDDLEEFQTIQERLVEALASGDSRLVEDLTADLDDLLFYVQ
jgi:molecular chaperone DnaK